MSKPPPDPVYTFHGDMKSVHSLLCHKKQDGFYIYCGTENGFVHIWNVQTLRQVYKVQVGTEPCVAILYCSYFITQEKGGDVSFWREDQFKWHRFYSFPCDVKTFCKILLIEQTLVYPYSDSQVKFTYLNKIVKGFKPNLESGLDLQNTGISQNNVVKNQDNVIQTSSEVEVHTSNEVNNQDFNISENLNTTFIKDGTISEHQNKVGMIMCSKFIINFKTLLLGYENGTICTIDISNGKIRLKKQLINECPVCFDYNHCKNFGVIGYNSKDIIKFEIDSEIKIINRIELKNAGSGSISIRNDGMVFVVGCWDSNIRYYSSKSMKLLAVLNSHTAPVECLCFANSEKDDKNNYLFAGSRDGRVSLWSLYSS